MADKIQVQNVPGTDPTVAKAKDFWTRNSKVILGVGVVLLLAVGGFYVYKHFFQGPKETKAADEMYKAEYYFRLDSVKLALNGDGRNPGFLKIIDRYSGTEAANLAHFYAGVCYSKLDDNANAVKHLKDFSTDAKQVQQRAYLLLGDAYADQGKQSEALEYYKKSARHFEEDQPNSAKALFRAAYFAQTVMNKPNDAIELYKELKQKYSRTEESMKADVNLARLGVYNVN